MEVFRLAHAGIVVSADGFRCLMDPILAEPFEAGANVFEPPAIIDPAFAARCDALILSHAHGDHFSVASLVHLPRGMPVFYPAGDDLIATALARLGFAGATPVTPGESRRVGPLTCTFTRSEVPFPEMGVLFEHDGQSLWNCVDSILGDAAFATVARRTKRLDAMLVAYQTLVEEPLWRDALGSGFPYDEYRNSLAAVRRAAPRCAMPSACGYRYADAALNARGFPVTEDEFLADLAVFAPEVSGVRLPPGTALDCGALTVCEVVPGALARAQAADQADRREWAPERGIEALRDHNPHGYPAAALRGIVGAWLDTACDAAASAAAADWRARLAAARAVWRLEIVYPDGGSEIRWMDFAAPHPRWISAAPRPPQIRTAIPASTIAGLLDGASNAYQALFTRRVAITLRTLEEGGMTAWGGLGDEPIARLLFPGADRRHLERELARFGYGRPSQALSRSRALGR